MWNKTFLLWAKTELWDKKNVWEDIKISDGNLKSKMWIESVREFTNTDQYKSIIVCIASLLKDFWLEYQNIDWIFCSSTWTYDVLPGLANVIASRIWLSKEKPRVNIWSACSWAIQSLYYANSEMKKRKEQTWKDQNFLIIASDIRSKTKDPTTMPMMSDASGVMLISTKQLGNSYEIWDISLNSMEADENSLRSIEQKHHEQLTMPNGKAVYKFAVQVGKEVFDTLVKWSWGAIFYIPHNANAKIIEWIEKSIWDNATVRKESIKEWNMGGASIIHWLESVLKNSNKPDQIILWAFGANLEYWGANLMKVDNQISEDKNYILPDLSFEALKNWKVWEFKEMIDTKTVWLSEINDSLVWYEYTSPTMCITQELVDFFVSIIWDRNPHYDKEISKDTKLWKSPVPGSLQQSMITNEAVIHNALKVTWSNHLVIDNNFNFRKPILVEDKIKYKLKIISARRWMVERDIRILVWEEEKGRWMFKSYYQKK